MPALEQLQRFRVGDITILLPRDWCETTEPGQVETLSRPNGTGAFQFSLALYESGKLPEFSADSLRRLLLDPRKHLGTPRDLVVESDPLLAAATWSDDETDLEVRYWYVSDGLNLGMVTYTSALSVE